MKKSSFLQKMLNAPYMLWSVLFIVAPLIMVGYYAFTDSNGAFTLDNIAQIGDYGTTFILSISYGAVAILVGIIREILANGTLMGINLNLPVHFSALGMPFGALIILGFMAAVLKAFINKKYPEANPDKSFDTSEIRRSLRGSLRELMKYEFNPYGEDSENDSAFVRVKKEKAIVKIRGMILKLIAPLM